MPTSLSDMQDLIKSSNESMRKRQKDISAAKSVPTKTVAVKTKPTTSRKTANVAAAEAYIANKKSQPRKAATSLGSKPKASAKTMSSRDKATRIGQAIGLGSTISKIRAREKMLKDI